MALPASQLLSILSSLGDDWEIAEAHGVLMGALCADLDAGQVVELVCGENKGIDEVALATVVRHLSVDLREGLLQFELALPSDDQLLSSRVRALARWVQGYLYGLSYLVGDLTNLDSEDQEILKDLVEIAKGAEVVGGDEQEEQAFTNLSEFTRAAVQHLYEDLVNNPSRNMP